MEDTLILIPAYRPTERLVELAVDLYSIGFRILVVNDGSGDAYSAVFDRVEAYATVIGYDENCGKGNALKYGLDFVRDQMSYFKYLITADADGQHSVDAIVAVSKRIHQTGGIVVGERNIEVCSIPNRICSYFLHMVYSLTTGIYVRDIMSGLRAFETCYLSWLMNVEGDSFDYEAYVLIDAAKRRYPIHTLKIKSEAADRKVSYYKLGKDAFLQLKAMCKLTWPSLSAVGINMLVILISMLIMGSGFAGIAAGVLFGSAAGIATSVYLNNKIGFEENFDGVLSYNRILMGLLRYNAYFFILEFLCALLGVPSLLAIILTFIIVAVIECAIMKAHLDDKLRIKNLPPVE